MSFHPVSPAQLPESKGAIDPAHRSAPAPLASDDVSAELGATRGQAYVSRDPLEPRAGDELRPQPGRICAAACERGCVDGLVTAGSSLLTTLFCAAIPASAVTVLAPAIGGCALCAGLYTGWNAYHATRNGLPQGRCWTAGVACATGAACAGAGAAAAAIGMSPLWTSGAQALANSIQLGMNVSRAAMRDGCNALLYGCSPAPRAVDSKGVDRGLSDPRMARMEVTRLLCSTVCYCAMQAVSVCVAQPALGHAMHAESLARVLHHDGGFLDRWLATAPGAIAGSVVEGLDGFFATNFAVASGLLTGNHSIVERRDRVDAISGNLHNLTATFVRALENALMRIGMGNPVVDSQVLATVWLDNSVMDSFIALLTQDQQISEKTITELRGKILSAAKAALQPPPRQHMHDEQEQTVFVPELGVYETRRMDAPAAREGEASSRESKRAAPASDIERLADAFEMDARFPLGAVGCKIAGINPATREVTIASSRALGRNWPAAREKKGDPYPFLYTMKRADMAAVLFEEGVRAHEIDRFTPYRVFHDGMYQATAIRDDKGEAVGIQRQPDGQWAVGDLEGEPAQLIDTLFEQMNVRARHLELPGGANEIVVGKRSITEFDHMVSHLWTGKSFELRSRADEIPVVTCTVTRTGIETDAALPGNLPRSHTHVERNGRHTYVFDRERLATWLLANFRVTEVQTRPAGPLAAQSQTISPQVSRRTIKYLASLLSDSKTTTLRVEIEGGRSREFGVHQRPGSGEIRLSRASTQDHLADTPQSLAKRVLELWWHNSPGATPEIDRTSEGVLTIHARRQHGPQAAKPATFEWQGHAASHDAKGAISQPGGPDESRGLPRQDDIANARSAIEQLQVDFGTPPRRLQIPGARPRPMAGVLPDTRPHNQRVLQACMRVLDGTSFLKGEVLPLGGIRSLMDLSGFPGGAGLADIEQVDRALMRGAGHRDMRLGAALATRKELDALEQARSEEVVPLLGAALADVVDGYARDWNMIANDMTDAAALLAAGSPAGSPARVAAARISDFARKGGDPRDLARATLDVEALRDKANRGDPLRRQAFAHLVRVFAELGGAEV